MKRLNGLVFLLFSLTLARGQDVNQMMTQAHRLFNAGQKAQALALFESIYQQHPHHWGVVSQYKHFLMQAQAYEKARALIDSALAFRPHDVGMKVERAYIDYKTGKTEKARSEWQELLDIHGQSATVYVQVANAMIRERLLDDAVDVYKMGRHRLKKPDLFQLNLGNLYSATLDYDQASREYLAYLKSHPKQIRMIEGQLLRFPKTEKTLKHVVANLEEAARRVPSDQNYPTLLLSVYLKWEAYDRALKAARDLERFYKDPMRGTALFRFGHQAFLDGQADLARQAFQEILDLCPGFHQKDQALLFWARAVEAGRKPAAAEAAYARVFEEARAEPVVVESLLHLARLQKENHAFDRASETLRTLIRRYPQRLEAFDARLLLGECRQALDDHPGAQAQFRQALKMNLGQNSAKKIRPLIYLARSRYFLGDFQGALALLDTLRIDRLPVDAFKDPALNDGLMLKLLLARHHQSDGEQLAWLSRGELLAYQHRADRAVAVLDSLVEKWPNHPLSARAMLQLAQMEEEEKKHTAALARLDTMLARFPQNFEADQALKLSAEIHEKLGHRKEALARYDRLLTQYAFSFLADDVRQRMRQMEEEK